MPADAESFGRPVALHKETVISKGRYCSLPCVKASIMGQPGYVRESSMSAFWFMCKRLGVSAWKVKVCPPFTLRNKYGGPLHDEEFAKLREECIDCSSVHSGAVVEMTRRDFYELIQDGLTAQGPVVFDGSSTGTSRASAKRSRDTLMDPFSLRPVDCSMERMNGVRQADIPLTPLLYVSRESKRKRVYTSLAQYAAAGATPGN